MDITGFVITGIKSIIGAVVPPLKKKFFDQPKIYLSFEYQSSTKKPRISDNNNETQPIDIMDAIWFNEFRWRYKLTLFNNSEHPAYNIKLLHPPMDNHFSLDKNIDRLNPLLQNTQVSYDAIFNDFFEGKAYDANEILENHPHILTSKKFVIAYTNVKGTKFYTIFTGNEIENLRNQFARKYKPD